MATDTTPIITITRNKDGIWLQFDNFLEVPYRIGEDDLSDVLEALKIMSDKMTQQVVIPIAGE